MSVFIIEENRESILRIFDWRRSEDARLFYRCSCDTLLYVQRTFHQQQQQQHHRHNHSAQWIQLNVRMHAPTLSRTYDAKTTHFHSFRICPYSRGGVHWTLCVMWAQSAHTHTHTRILHYITRVARSHYWDTYIFVLILRRGACRHVAKNPKATMQCILLPYTLFRSNCVYHPHPRQSVTLVVLSYPRVYLHHQAHCSLPLSASMLCSAFSLSVIATNNTPMCAKYTEPSFGCRNPKSFESDIVFTHALWPPIFARMCVRFGSCRFRVPSPAHTHTRVRSFIHCACRSGSRVHQQWLSFEQRVWLCEDARYTLLCENRLGFRIFQIYI